MPTRLLLMADTHVPKRALALPDVVWKAVDEADVVVCLTTEPGSVMRAAYEAVYACRPLIISGWPIAREVFPFALPVEHHVAALSQAFRDADARYDELAAQTEAARELQLARFDAQRLAVARRLSELVSAR